MTFIETVILEFVQEGLQLICEFFQAPFYCANMIIGLKTKNVALF